MEYLRFNDEQFMKDLSMNLKNALTNDFADFKSDVLNRVQWEDALQKGKVETKVNNTIDEILAIVEANAYIIADSYGTGTESILSLSSEIFKDYMQSDYWNELRKSKQIVGRKEGEYINFFGEKVKSSGSKAGDKVNVPEIPATSSIPDAWKEMFNTKIPNTVNRVLDSIDFSKYFTFR
jgi:hypothetical protein